MESRIRLLAVPVLAVLAFVVFWAEPCVCSEGPTAGGAGAAVSEASFPYVAEITGNDVYIRVGPGTNYYTCGKLNKGDRVKVVSVRLPWSQIVPPAGSFSWISSQYVSIDPDDPNTGIVGGDNVRVYAGSDFVRPIHSTRLQGKLGGGDKVKLLGEQKDDYYKISPPPFAYLWVSSEFVSRVAPVQVGTTVPVTVTVVEPNDEPNATTAVAVTLTAEAEKLKEYRALEQQLAAERTKAPEQQDYSSIKKKLAAIAGDKEAGKAARYAEFVVKKIERFELALAVSRQLKLQDEELRQTRERIDRARATRLAAVEDLGRFAAIGRLESSKIYGPEAEVKRFRILDASGKTICYAVASGPAAQKDLSGLMNRKVGLVGTIEAHPQTAGALVRFTDAVGLK
jgi:hypothetical protein